MGWLGFGINRSSTAGKERKEDADASVLLEEKQLKDGKSEGYCSVSDDLEPCQWEILPSGGVEAPLFRIIF
ncbi:hypothetical protein Mapa_001408 [Marchantia paleacea]|nr:hypothetical protein Mapa_001408 [Marchantia paleacea]